MIRQKEAGRGHQLYYVGKYDLFEKTLADTCKRGGANYAEHSRNVE